MFYTFVEWAIAILCMNCKLIWNTVELTITIQAFYLKKFMSIHYTYIYIWIFKYTNSPSHLTLLGLCNGISGEKVAPPLFFWSVFKRTLYKSMLFFLVKTHWWAKIGGCNKIKQKTTSKL